MDFVLLGVLRAFSLEVLRFIRWLPLRARLALSARRYSAFPFTEWSENCPVCGGSYDDHQRAGVGSAPLPAQDFVSALENGRWGDAFAIGREPDLMGDRDLVGSIILRCPVRQQLCVFVFRSPFGVTRPSTLISQQIVTEESAKLLSERIDSWSPVVRDLLLDIQADELRLKRVPIAPNSWRDFAWPVLIAATAGGLFYLSR